MSWQKSQFKALGSSSCWYRFSPNGLHRDIASSNTVARNNGTMGYSLINVIRRLRFCPWQGSGSDAIELLKMAMEFKMLSAGWAWIGLDSVQYTTGCLLSIAHSQSTPCVASLHPRRLFPACRHASERRCSRRQFSRSERPDVPPSARVAKTSIFRVFCGTFLV